MITPPLESDGLESGSPFEHQAGLQNRPASDGSGPYHQYSVHLIGDLPDSPDSLSNQNSASIEQRFGSNLLDSLSSTLNDLATHSHLHQGGHRFHPFNQNGGTVGGGNHSSASSQNSSHSSSAHSLAQSSSSAHSSSSAASSSSHFHEQMPETDCYFPTTNMLDYHLNPAYIGELSPTKCNDYQVNGYTSNYYSRCAVYGETISAITRN